jgi:hypothetical protein
MQALKEGALNRLMVDGQGMPLSPQKAATAIKTALNGNAAETYGALFSKDEIAKLNRYRDPTGNHRQGHDCAQSV